MIELSERLLEAEERACMQTLAHEVAPHLPRLPQPWGPLEGVRRADEWGLRLCHLPYRHL